MTEEQLRSLSQEGDEGGIRPFRGDETSKERSINVFQHKTVSNQYGIIYEVGTRDFKPLHDVDVNVAFVNITEVSSTTFDQKLLQYCSAILDLA